MQYKLLVKAIVVTELRSHRDKVKCIESPHIDWNGTNEIDLINNQLAMQQMARTWIKEYLNNHSDENDNETIIDNIYIITEKYENDLIAEKNCKFIREF